MVDFGLGSLSLTTEMEDNEKQQLNEWGYVVTRKLGEGASGQVYHAVCNDQVTAMIPLEPDDFDETGTPRIQHEFSERRNCLVKNFNLNGVSCALKRMIDREKRDKESQIMMALKHRNIVQVYKTLEIDANYYIVMEYLTGDSTLENYLTQLNVNLDEFSGLLIIKQVTLGMQHIHQMGIAHMDLNAHNIIAHCHGDLIVWKIIDFGLSEREEDEFYNDVFDYHDLNGRILEVLNRTDVEDSKRQDIQHLLEELEKKRKIPKKKRKDEKIMDWFANELLPLLVDNDEPPEGSAAKELVQIFKEKNEEVRENLTGIRSSMG